MPDYQLRVKTNSQIAKYELLNRRKAVRYVRHDINASLSKIKVFRNSTPCYVNLLDISTRGALINTEIKLPINKKLILILSFIQGKTFTIPATIVRKQYGGSYTYGLKFSKPSDQLGEFLLNTQTELIFK